MGQHNGVGAPGALQSISTLVASLPQGTGFLQKPATVLDSELPQSLQELYRAFDGVELFENSLVIFPSADIETVPRADDDGDMQGWHIGEIDGDDLLIDAAGSVWRIEEDSGERLPEGRDLIRWLWGTIEAQSLLYDDEGEFREDVFEESGDIDAEIRARMGRKVLKRDARAPGPRWRLARALSELQRFDESRDHLEQVVAEAPDFSWAWFDLATISETRGELDSAIDELTAALDARPDYEHAGFFWAQAARLAVLLGDEQRRATYSARALECNRELVQVQREGATETLLGGDPSAAMRLIEVALALSPRDVASIDLRTQILDILESEPQNDDFDDDDFDDD